MNKIILLLLLTWPLSHVISSDDSTLYVKTVYQHEIYNGRNTARQTAIRQEMRDSDGILFREVFYNVETKQVDNVLYYFYNNDGTIRLIEKVDSKEKLYEYFVYAYKKKKLSSINHYQYNLFNNSSELITSQNYSYKKNTTYLKETDSENKILKTIESVYENNNPIKESIVDNTNDSAHNKKTSFEYQNGLLYKEIETVISTNLDTTILIKKYVYKENNLMDTLSIYDLSNNLISNTIYSYTKNGSLINKKTIGKNNYYLENLTYDLKKYYRDLPRKKPQF